MVKFIFTDNSTAVKSMFMTNTLGPTKLTECFSIHTFWVLFTAEKKNVQRENVLVLRFLVGIHAVRIL